MGKKHALVFLLALAVSGSALAADPVAPAVPASQPAAQTIKVKNVKELIAAIGSNRVIELAPGDYDLSEIEHKATRNLRWGADPNNGDDNSLVIRHVENLTLQCAGDKAARITTPDAAVTVLTFVDATNLTLRNLELVHDVQGDCSAGVIALNDVHTVGIEKCTLSGSGSEGITAAEVDGLTFKNSIITHCSSTILTVTEMTHATFVDSSFKDNKVTDTPLTFNKSSAVSFTHCTFQSNKPEDANDIPEAFISADDESKIEITNCELNDNTGTDLLTGDGTITTKDCTTKDNAFTFDPSEKHVPKNVPDPFGPGFHPGMGRGAAMGGVVIPAPPP